MAVNEGIRSPFPTQPSAPSPKLRIYESLFLLNQSVDQVVAILHGMEKFPFADKESLESAQAEIEEVRASMNADFTEQLGDRFDEGRFWKRRRALEKKWRDPDDVYIDVERREEQRKKQGLPPRLGIVPHSAVAEEEQRWEAQKSGRKSSPESAGSNDVETDHDKQAEGCVGRKHAYHPDHSQATQEAAQADEKAPGDAA